MATYTDIGREFFPPMGQAQKVKDLWGNVIAPQDPNRIYIGPNVDWGTLAKALAGAAGLMTPDLGMPLQIKALHGSPHKFSKFMDKAIGTGEGAQAFGHGHYLTESPEVAKSYAEMGKSSRRLQEIYGDVWPAVRHYAGGNKKGALQIMDINIREQEELVRKYGYKPGEPPFEAIQKYKNIRERMLENKLEVPQYVYETTIHKGKKPSEYTYLEWDKPLSGEQIRKIDSLLEKEYPKAEQIWHKVKQYESMPITGGYAYNYLSSALGGNVRATQFFSRAGFSGIKYPTGSLSGMKETGKYNYVVFNPEDITIEAMK